MQYLIFSLISNTKCLYYYIIYKFLCYTYNIQWHNYKILAHVQYYFMAPKNRYMNKIRQLHVYIYIYKMYNYIMYYNIYNS